MPVRSSDRKLSFSTLATSDAETDQIFILRSTSDPSAVSNHHSPKKKKRKKKAKKSVLRDDSVESSEIERVIDRDGAAIDNCSSADGFSVNNYSYTILETVPTVVVPELSEGRGSDYSVRTVALGAHLRQRSVNVAANGGIEAEAVAPTVMAVGSVEHGGSEIAEKESERVNEADLKLDQQQQRPYEMNGRTLEKEESLDWKKVMAEDPSCKWICIFLLYDSI